MWKLQNDSIDVSLEQGAPEYPVWTDTLPTKYQENGIVNVSQLMEECREYTIGNVFPGLQRSLQLWQIIEEVDEPI